MKLVELGRQRDGHLILERCALEPLAPGCIADGNIEQFETVADALRRVVRQSGTRTRQAALALPSSAVITKKITVAGGLSESELESQVQAEASQYLPFSLEEVSLDFCVMGPVAGRAEVVDVLIAASRKERVQDRQDLAEAAGLKPVILDIESFASRVAAARLAESLPADSLGDGVPMVALFEVGAHCTGMQVLRGEDVLYDRDQAFGGAQLTQQIARTYGVPPDEAEQRKRRGDLPPDYAAHLLPQFVDDMAQDIARALQFFFNSTPHHRVDCVLLAGGCASLPGLAEAVARLTSFACRPADPFTGMRVGSAVSAGSLQGQAPSYLTCCGLALRRFLP
ncbi:MAG: putative type pilus assembly protein [Pseudomonadota bacterium]